MAKKMTYQDRLINSAIYMIIGAVMICFIYVFFSSMSLHLDGSTVFLAYVSIIVLFVLGIVLLVIGLVFKNQSMSQNKNPNHMFCSGCGKLLKSDDSFCSKCGKKLLV